MWCVLDVVGEEHDIENDVDYGGDNQPNNRCTAVAQGTENCGGHIVKKICGDACKYSQDINVCTLKDILGGTGHFKYLCAEDDSCCGNDSTEDYAKPKRA